MTKEEFQYKLKQLSVYKYDLDRIKQLILDLIGEDELCEVESPVEYENEIRNELRQELRDIIQVKEAGV